MTPFDAETVKFLRASSAMRPPTLEVVFDAADAIERLDKQVEGLKKIIEGSDPLWPKQLPEINL